MIVGLEWRSHGLPTSHLEYNLAKFNYKFRSKKTDFFIYCQLPIGSQNISICWAGITI
jgi:hypothetical protein